MLQYLLHTLETQAGWSTPQMAPRQNCTNATTTTAAHPTVISPVVTRFFWPPEMPRIMLLPMGVSAQYSRPRICILCAPVK